MQDALDFLKLIRRPLANTNTNTKNIRVESSLRLRYRYRILLIIICNQSTHCETHRARARQQCHLHHIIQFRIKDVVVHRDFHLWSPTSSFHHYISLSLSLSLACHPADTHTPHVVTVTVLLLLRRLHDFYFYKTIHQATLAAIEIESKL